jgi:hypothetical protein
MIEFVKMFSRVRGPLSPDAFSQFSKHTASFKQDNDEIIEATGTILHPEEIQKLTDMPYRVLAEGADSKVCYPSKRFQCN